MLEIAEISESATDEVIRAVLRSTIGEDTALILLPWSTLESLLMRIMEVLRHDDVYKHIPVFIGESSDAQALHTAAWLRVDAKVIRDRAALKRISVQGAA